MATPPKAAAPASSCRLEVKVIPGASRDEVAGTMGEAVKIKLRAPPVDGRANEALVAFLAAQLDLPKRAITLERGVTQRQKLLRIEGLDLAAVRARLGL